MPNPVNSAIGTLLDDSSQIGLALSSPASILALVSAEATALGVASSPNTDLWPTQCLGKADRLLLAGVPNIEKHFHPSLEQGRFNESSIGDALASLEAKKKDLEEKITHYLSLNQLAIHGKLSDTPRALLFAKDSIQFIQQVQTYMNQTAMLVAAAQANIRALMAAEMRIVAMIDKNISALQNLLNEICNWGIPNLPSFPALLGSQYHWNGFNFNAATGFTFQTGLLPNLNFSFSLCTKLVTNYASLFGVTTSLSDGNLVFSAGALPLPLNGIYGDPTQFTTPSYIAEMQATSTAVFNPALVLPVSTISLPSPASIISNFSLPAAAYVANVVSATPALTPAVIQVSDTDYSSSTPTPARIATLRSLLVRFVTLEKVVESNYDPNLTAAWLLYLDLNRNGRSGSWLDTFQSAYQALVAPSAAYIKSTPVPWNEVLGGTAVNSAPIAIPLISTLQGASSPVDLWKLSYIEASLLGYPRTTLWDAAADATYLAGATGSDVDYVPTAVDTGVTSTLVLGAGTAAYPVSATFPTPMTAILTQVVSLAAADIQANPSYQSTRPQFRFTYDTFGDAKLVDRFTQFWRVFNANLVALLLTDPYVLDFTVSYVAILNSALNPLADAGPYSDLEADASSRNRSWTPGSSMLPIPKAIELIPAGSLPTDATNGWTSGTLDPSAYLARPDVQAQSLPVQMAMLRTSQGLSKLMDMKTTMQTTVSRAVVNNQTVMAENPISGWSMQTTADQVAASAVVFGSTLLDQTGFVQSTSSVSIPVAGTFTLCTSLLWDTTGPAGTRTAAILVNGSVVASVSCTSASDTPYNTATSTSIAVNEGDLVRVDASHSLGTPQNLLAGGTFLGLMDPA